MRLKSAVQFVAAATLLGVSFNPGTSTAQEGAIGFSSERWTMVNARVIEHAGREALMGFAYLEDVTFEDGVIEVDVYVEQDARTYPGVVFRIQSQDDHERFYIRPHRAPFYPDALQYTPVFNGIAGWQLYNGEGFTAGAEIPEGEWTHLKLEVSGTQARVTLGDSDVAALEIHDLKRGESGGSVGVFGPADGTAYFSGFSYRTDGDLRFDPPPVRDERPGMINEWEISRPFALGELDREIHPAYQDLEDLDWERVESDASGLVDVSRRCGRTGREPDCVYARATIYSEVSDLRKYLLGYSDEVHVFLNGKLLFHGMSAYRQRDPSFLGIVGLNDAVYLPLEEGENELMLLVAEAFGGWGFMCGDGEAVFTHHKLNEAWRTDAVFLVPETVVYDPSREALYVSNYDMYGKAAGGGGQFISKLSLEGEIQELRWARGLYNPVGMAVSGDRLYVIERRGLVEIITSSGEVVGRHQNPDAAFQNDLATAGDGAVYISDTGSNAIFKFKGGEFEKWMQGAEIDRPNGMAIRDGKLIFGNNGDTKVKMIDLGSKSVTTLADMGGGTIDGIEIADGDDYLVSLWEGKLFRMTPGGAAEKLLDTTMTGVNCANFAYIPSKGLLLVPTFADNRVVAYELVE